MIYLDTHAVIWLYEDNLSKFSKQCLELLAGNEILLVSPAVKLELKYLHEINKISTSANDVLNDLKYRIGLTLCHASFDDIVTTAMEMEWTRDPFDRLIVGHAAIGSHLLISKDNLIRTHYKHAYW